MDGLTKFDAVYVILVFVVPGYVFMSLHNQFVAGQGKLTKDQVLSYFTVSSLNFASFGWIVYFAYSYNLSVPFKALSWVVVTVLIPAAAGILWGTFNQRDLIRKVYNHFGLTPIHTIPHAWDYKFSKSPGEWVLITLKNGIRFAGVWAGNSFASDDPAERDILVERVYEIPRHGPWKPTNKSLLVAAGEISTIEFTPIEEP